MRDVSFEVYPGESIGIIGRNGAGKSTLLKILSRITPPTSGRIVSRGRIASLLEVGTGFHQELSGRENIYMNGSILGMKKREIDKQFDNIVDFSGTEKFLDTPLKHYSSGMQLRLAFAVAAHLEPEILIIDEVLAVGDAEFQKKCLGKMEDVSKSGRTIIFVSHNMESLRQLCTRGLLLKTGALEINSDIDSVATAYLKNRDSRSQSMSSVKSGISIEEIQIYDDEGRSIESLTTYQSIRIECHFISNVNRDDVTFAICFDNIYEKRATTLWSSFQNKKYSVSPGRFKVVFEIPSLHLVPGEYSMVSYIESRGVEIERIDNLRRTIVSYGAKDFSSIPSIVHGSYLENFTVQIEKDVKEYY
nr:ABC transporter ATP-binding protein [Chryseosolibacter indicus]